MSTVKLGKLTLPQFAAEKPIGVRGDGTLMYAKEIIAGKTPPKFGLDLTSFQNKAKLAIARIKMESDLKIGVISEGIYNQREIISHIENQTSLGKQIADAEIKYSEFLLNQMLGKTALLSDRFVMPKEIALPAVPAEWKIIPKAKWISFRNKVLFCENTTDSVTNQAALYRINNVHPVFANRGFEVIKLDGVNDNRTNFAARAKESRVVYIGGIGHGNYDLYTGHGNSSVLRIGAYDPLEVQDCSLHFLSCRTGRDLGPNTIAKGAKSYTGYSENFTFTWANSTLFWKADSQFDISMAIGRTVQQAIADTVNQFNVGMATVPGTSTAALLMQDRDLLRSPVSGAAWGSKTDTVLPYVFYNISLKDFANRSV
ncbi:hypothetical protein [Chryseobacterium caseinilyticum]|uniref:Gingipain domain-containing protein n=1 Tax=Chryseobacterium caseinilyticum TaxID=2771428 RepID=A0ABR8ZF40_9FLAO|nr:hypothetical protein [Chryseobacterium caseinilyticum]MBD8083336.1 hypothetical protein [Chryseobacterium caseinilyticum]